MTKLSPAKVKAASNSSVLLMKFVLAATFADSIARRSFPVGGAALTTCKLLREEDDRFWEEETRFFFVIAIEDDDD